LDRILLEIRRCRSLSSVDLDQSVESIEGSVGFEATLASHHGLKGGNGKRPPRWPRGVDDGTFKVARRRIVRAANEDVPPQRNDLSEVIADRE
jgi:hypothetical protein